jgi:hypothetical protein
VAFADCLQEQEWFFRQCGRDPAFPASDSQNSKLAGVAEARLRTFAMLQQVVGVRLVELEKSSIYLRSVDHSLVQWHLGEQAMEHAAPRVRDLKPSDWLVDPLFLFLPAKPAKPAKPARSLFLPAKPAKSVANSSSESRHTSQEETELVVHEMQDFHRSPLCSRPGAAALALVDDAAARRPKATASLSPPQTRRSKARDVSSQSQFACTYTPTSAGLLEVRDVMSPVGGGGSRSGGGEGGAEWEEEEEVFGRDLVEQLRRLTAVTAAAKSVAALSPGGESRSKPLSSAMRTFADVC